VHEVAGARAQDGEHRLLAGLRFRHHDEGNAIELVLFEDRERRGRRQRGHRPIGDDQIPSAVCERVAKRSLVLDLQGADREPGLRQLRDHASRLLLGLFDD